MNALLVRCILVTEDQIKMTFEQFKSTALLGLATVFVSIAGFVASSVFKLNENVAVIVEKVNRHDDEIRELRSEVKEARESRAARGDYHLLPQKGGR